MQLYISQFSSNHEFIFHNSDFSLQNCKFISFNSEFIFWNSVNNYNNNKKLRIVRKKSEWWDFFVALNMWVLVEFSLSASLIKAKEGQTITKTVMNIFPLCVQLFTLIDS